MTWYAIQLLAVFTIVVYILWLRSDMRREARRHDWQQGSLDESWRRYNRLADAHGRLRVKWRQLRFVSRRTWNDGYRDGQIDAANGKMNYELRDQADGSRAWERNDDGN
jgi:hypothetical protein